MSSEHVEVLLQLKGRVGVDCSGVFLPTGRTSPEQTANVDAALDAAIAALSAPQPPAEAQPVACDWPSCDCTNGRAECGRKISQTPSAPVGECPDCTNSQQCDSCCRGEGAVLEASAPVGVEERAKEIAAEFCPRGDYDHGDVIEAIEYALAQQPAAVDGAVTGGGVVLPRYFLDFLLGQGALEGFWFSDKPATEKGQFWWRSRLRALAAKQQGGSDNDR